MKTRSRSKQKIKHNCDGWDGMGWDGMATTGRTPFPCVSHSLLHKRQPNGVHGQGLAGDYSMIFELTNDLFYRQPFCATRYISGSYDVPFLFQRGSHSHDNFTEDNKTMSVIKRVLLSLLLGGGKLFLGCR